MKKPWSKRHAQRIENTRQYHAKLSRYSQDLKQYPSPVYVKTRDDKSYLKRLYRSPRHNSRAAWYSRCCNRSVRYYRGDIKSGAYYRRIADFWWLLY